MWHTLSCENCGEIYAEVIHLSEDEEIEEVDCPRCRRKKLCASCEWAE